MNSECNGSLCWQEHRSHLLDVNAADSLWGLLYNWWRGRRLIIDALFYLLISDWWNRVNEKQFMYWISFPCLFVASTFRWRVLSCTLDCVVSDASFVSLQAVKLSSLQPVWWGKRREFWGTALFQKTDRGGGTWRSEVPYRNQRRPRRGEGATFTACLDIVCSYENKNLTYYFIWREIWVLFLYGVHWKIPGEMRTISFSSSFSF